MEDDKESQSQTPQLKSVVIISIPPSNNPSLGKKITAFTFSNNPFSPQQQPQNNVPPMSPIQSYPSNHQLQFSSTRRFFHTTQIKFFTFFGIFLFALFLYGSLFSTITTTLELSELKNHHHDGGDDEFDEPSSFLFPLFKKYGVVGQRDLKLIDVKKGNFVTQKSGDSDGIAFSSRVVAVDSSSSTVFPISGNVYPDGYVKNCCFLLV